jgi:hypothetical protein
MSMFFAHLLIQNQSMDPFLLGRLLHFALCIALWPYALGTFVVSLPERSRKAMKVSFCLWFVLGLPLLGVVLAVFR